MQRGRLGARGVALPGTIYQIHILYWDMYIYIGIYDDICGYNVYIYICIYIYRSSGRKEV